MSPPLLEHPLFFSQNRVWRCYKGGFLLDEFRGSPEPCDGHFPEDWLASTTRALNGPDQQHPDEGLSRLRLVGDVAGPTLLDTIAAHPEACLGHSAGNPDHDVGVLCKFLDSAVRLPIQCHPDRAFARKHYHSDHGKEESWLILGTRDIDGESPYLLMGFREHVRADLFADAVRRQGIPAMVDMLHRFSVRPGDSYIIPGRFPHAIGPGVFMLEVQEPTDWVVQPEQSLAGRQLSAYTMWGPLTPEIGLHCFDYESRDSAEATLDRVRLRPEVVYESGPARLEQIVGPSVTGSFRVDRLTVTGSYEFIPRPPYHIGIVTAGSGWLETAARGTEIARGDSYFVPYQVRKLRLEARGPTLVVYLVST